MCLFHHTLFTLYLLIHDGISYTAWHEWILLLHILTIANTLTHVSKHQKDSSMALAHIYVTYVMMMMILDWQLRTLMLYYSWFHSLSYLIWLYTTCVHRRKISISLNTYTNNAHFIILLSQHCPPFSFHFKCLSFSTQHEEPFFKKFSSS